MGSLSVLQERQKQLESLGISLQSSGIKVGDDKSFLVNLNADPALNELLVYYLKVHAEYQAKLSQKLNSIQVFHTIFNPSSRFKHNISTQALWFRETEVPFPAGFARSSCHLTESGCWWKTVFCVLGDLKTGIIPNLKTQNSF